MVRISAFVFAFIVFMSNARADWRTTYEDAKKDFDARVEQISTEGLTAEQVESLTDHLLDIAGDEIEGTGTETLLQTLNQQAGNIAWGAEKKEQIERLVEFVKHVYALGSSDGGADPVEAYKALGEGIDLAADFAGEAPVIGEVVGPMLKAYAKAIKNGEAHIEAIANATKEKNKIIQRGWRGYTDEELAEIAGLDELEPEQPPTAEELALAAWEEEQRVEEKRCREQCHDEFLAYDQAAWERPKALALANETRSEWERAVRLANGARKTYNEQVARNEAERQGFLDFVSKRNQLAEELALAESRGNRAAVRELTRMLRDADRKVDKKRNALRQSYRRAARMLQDYLEARAQVSELLAAHRDAVEDYNAKHAVYLAAKAAYEACIARCKEEGEVSSCAAPIEIAASGATFGSMPTSNPAAFGFGGDVRGVSFDGPFEAGQTLTDEYAEIGVLMNGIRIDSNVYGGVASGTFATEHNSPQVFTFTVPVVAAGIINTSPDQDFVEAWSGPNGTGELLLSFRDQYPGTKDYNVDRFVGVRTCSGQTIGSLKVYNNSGDLELDELILEVAAE